MNSLALMALAVVAWGPYNAELVRVLDADTFEVTVAVWPSQENRARIRLMDVDAWELRCKDGSGERARAWAIEWLDRGELTITVQGVDSFGRYLADVQIGGESMSDALLKAGHGRPYKRGAEKCP